jgi:hypothetical protein
MHNCKIIRSSLTDLALDEIQPQLKNQLHAELEGCSACQEEYASIKDALRVSGQALGLTLPAESFWSGYHSRLVDRIENYSPARLRLSWGLRMWLGIQKLSTTSVRVPVPVATAALVLLFGALSFFAWQSRRPVTAPPSQITSVITKTVEVPVIQEKVVTRIVYVEKNRSRSRSVPNQLDRAEPPATGLAQANPAASETTAISLVGFKPTDQVKLKIMKGSYRDEK